MKNCVFSAVHADCAADDGIDCNDGIGILSAGIVQLHETHTENGCMCSAGAFHYHVKSDLGNRGYAGLGGKFNNLEISSGLKRMVKFVQENDDQELSVTYTAKCVNAKSDGRNKSSTTRTVCRSVCKDCCNFIQTKVGIPELVRPGPAGAEAKLSETHSHSGNCKFNISVTLLAILFIALVVVAVIALYFTFNYLVGILNHGR